MPTPGGGAAVARSALICHREERFLQRSDPHLAGRSLGDRFVVKALLAMTVSRDFEAALRGGLRSKTSRCQPSGSRHHSVGFVVQWESGSGGDANLGKAAGRQIVQMTKRSVWMKVEYEWHAGDDRGRMETITEAQEHKPRPWWCWALLVLLGGLVGAALAYGGYVAVS